jgi:hypothetical protein
MLRPANERIALIPMHFGLGALPQKGSPRGTFRCECDDRRKDIAARATYDLDTAEADSGRRIRVVA